MEQLSLFDAQKTWVEKTEELLDKLIVELELPEKSLYLRTETGKNDTITSRSICIYEPEYPKLIKANEDKNRNAVVLRITEKHLKKEGNYLDVSVTDSNQIGDIETPPDAIEMANSIRLRPDSDYLIPYFEKSVHYALANYQSKAASFGCCSRFMECSNVKKCVHENKLYSKACMYREHLDNGEIFYGENRNVD